MIATGTNGARAASLKERQREERAALILRAASDLLIEKGYHDASMDEIAARVGISKGALYLHFASKEALVVRLLEQEIAEYLALIDQVVRQRLTVRARLERILLETYTTIDGRHHLLLILRSMGWNRSVIWERLEKQLPLAELTERLAKLFEEGKQSGELDTTIATSVMVALFLSLMRMYGDRQFEESQPLSPQAFVAAVCQVLFQGLSAPPSDAR
jgi:AcrR family transcriptional regulator